MKSKIIVGITAAIGTSIGLVIALWANNEMVKVDTVGLTLINPITKQNDEWQNILFTVIGLTTMVACVVMGWVVGRKYYVQK